MTRPPLRFVVSAPRGLVDLVLAEARELGATDAQERGAQVRFSSDALVAAYRICLEARVASRIYLELFEAEVADDRALYARLRDYDWPSCLASGATLACEFSGRHPSIVNSHYAALRVKDAIVDALRAATGTRPDVDTERPGVRVHVHARGAALTVSLDLAGEGLHRRGWRARGLDAPLRENVAAGMLLRSQWPARAREGAAFVDPMCGSGTLLIEAAGIAADIAPNLQREYFGFLGWRGHDTQCWAQLRSQATQRAAAGIARLQQQPLVLQGHDRDARAIEQARRNARLAGVDGLVALSVAELETLQPPAPRGLLATNPPYGLRLGDREQARGVHEMLGRVLRERFAGWQAAVLTAGPELGLELGLRASRTHALWNGGVEARLLRFELDERAARDLRPRRDAIADPALAQTPGARMFANRIARNLRVLRSWARRESVSCYRIYDADMPEYAFAIDLYAAAHDGARRWLVVQEYAAPAEIPEADVRRRRGEALAALALATGVAPADIHLKLRRRRVRGEQYERARERHGELHEVGEGGLRFLVNFRDYLDTGLFLDHRLTRARLREAARERDMLNLFAYTATASVYAAAGGARSTTSVDLSNTYLEWARRNLELNGFSGSAHRLERADVREWLDLAALRGRSFDLIFLDPPTFSNSARMDRELDVQRDHAALVEASMRVLRPAGLLVFSTNAQRFEPDASLTERYDVREITRATLPRDFERNPRIHRCFELRHGPAGRAAPR